MRTTNHRHMKALGEATRGLAQQMVWWGCDVRHSSGNLLVRHGMDRLPSPGLAGTSCYRMPWEGGRIELHGVVASWTSGDSRSAMAYSRDQGRISLWMGERPPVPGFEFGSHGTAQERWEAALPMIRWIADYEKWVLERVGPAWRQACRKHIRRLPRGKSWLTPTEALDWWRNAASTSDCQHPVDF